MIEIIVKFPLLHKPCKPAYVWERVESAQNLNLNILQKMKGDFLSIYYIYQFTGEFMRAAYMLCIKLFTWIQKMNYDQSWIAKIERLNSTWFSCEFAWLNQVLAGGTTKFC